MDDLLDRLRDELHQGAEAAVVGRYPHARVERRAAQRARRRRAGVSVAVLVALVVGSAGAWSLRDDRRTVSVVDAPDGPLPSPPLEIPPSGTIQVLGGGVGWGPTWLPAGFEPTYEESVSESYREIVFERGSDELRMRRHIWDQGGTVSGTLLLKFADSPEEVRIGPLLGGYYVESAGTLLWDGAEGSAFEVEAETLSRPELLRVANSIAVLGPPYWGTKVSPETRLVNLAGLDYLEATTMLRRRGYQVRWHLGSTAETAGVVQSTEPQADELVPTGQMITLIVSAPELGSDRDGFVSVADGDGISPGVIRAAYLDGRQNSSTAPLPVTFLHGQLVGFMGPNGYVTMADGAAGNWGEPSATVSTSVDSGEPAYVPPEGWRRLTHGELELWAPPEAVVVEGDDQTACGGDRPIVFLGGGPCRQPHTSEVVAIRPVGPADADAAERCDPGGVNRLQGCSLEDRTRRLLLLEGGLAVEITGPVTDRLEAMHLAITWLDGQERWESPVELAIELAEAARTGDDAALRDWIDPNVDQGTVTAAAKALLADVTAPPVQSDVGERDAFARVSRADGTTVEIEARFRYDIDRKEGRWLAVRIQQVDRPLSTGSPDASPPSRPGAPPTTGPG